MKPPLAADIFAQADARKKSALIGRLFSGVADYYDRMNDVMSLGAHRLWKRTAAHLLDIQPGMRVLDIAGGSGDMSRLARARSGATGLVVLSDVNSEMLAAGRDRAGRRRVGNGGDGGSSGITAVQCDGGQLPFADGSFDRAVNAFGLRNMTARPAALAEMCRVLRVGGKSAVLEFSPQAACPAVHRRYLTDVLPLMGKLIADDEDSYRYLGQSILQFDTPAQTTAALTQAGFGEVRHYRLAAGAVALHIARKMN